MQYSFNEINYVRFDKEKDEEKHKQPSLKALTSLRSDQGLTCNSLPRYTKGRRRVFGNFSPRKYYKCKMSCKITYLGADITKSLLSVHKEIVR